jgi:hypothetical protein
MKVIYYYHTYERKFYKTVSEQITIISDSIIYFVGLLCDVSR